MKIALFVHCFFPAHYFGTEAYTLNLARELQALGHAPTVVSATFQGETRQKRLVESYDWQGIPVLSIDKNAVPHRDIAGTYDQPIMRWVHERILRQLQPDAVHVCHLINHTRALLDATAALGIPTFATLTDFYGFCLTNRLEAAHGGLCAGPNRTRSNCIACHLKAAAGQPGSGLLSRALGSPALRPLAAPALALAGRIRPAFQAGSLRPADIIRRPDVLREALAGYKEAIAPSTFLRDAYAANGFPAPLRLSHFGIDIDRSAKPPPPAPETLRLGYIGQLAAHKGVDILLSALKAAARPNLSLKIWGDEGQDAAYAGRLRTLAAGQPVQFEGTFMPERLAGIFADLDLLVIPSTWYENSPLILLQALATHTPVVVSDVAGLTEFIVPEVSGFAVPRGNTAALTALLARLADRPDAVHDMSPLTHYARTVRDMAADVVAMYAGHGLPSP
ncbi:D-inositol-3-phosphate glycosyltransferase [Alphaproteobacteria bacterium SO-S41]|nr:D-inositol-3-phosphate glycosyltransferase [Alphaproteobacteria bacterium SO-S41]